MGGKDVKRYKLYKRAGSNLWQVSLTLSNGKRVQRATGEKLKRDAEKAALKILQDDTFTGTDNPTFAEYSEGFFREGGRWWGDMAARYKRKGGLSPRTAMEKKSILRNRVIPHLGNARLQSINRNSYRKVRDGLSEKLSPPSVNKALETLWLILGYAVEDGIIERVPETSGIKISVKTDTVGAFTLDEFRRILFDVEWPNQRLWLFNLTAALLGLRQGELLALRRESFQEPGKILVDKSYNQRLKILNPSTKTGKSRKVPILPFLENKLLSELEKNPSPLGPGQYVFFSDNTPLRNKPFDGKRALDALRVAMRKAGICEEEERRRGLRFHSWRHFCNTTMVNSGLPSLLIQHLTGHASERMTKHYFDAESIDNTDPLLEIQRQLMGTEKKINPIPSNKENI